MKKILFIHQNFPAQFVHLSRYLKNLSYDVQSMSYSDKCLQGIPHHKCVCKRSNTKNVHPLVMEFESKILRAETTLKKCRELYTNNKYYPDIIIAHCGWGESLLLKLLWPKTKIIDYMELYYDNSNAKLITRNAPYLISLTNSDAFVSPTLYQRNTFPKEFHNKIQIIFEGINTDKFKRQENNCLKIGLLKNENVKWKHKIVYDSEDNNYSKIYNIDRRKDKVITFISRDLTPVRGYNTFMYSLPNILEKNPNAYVIIVGGDGNSYINAPPDGKTYKDIFFNRVKDKIKDTSRIFFLGKVIQKSLIDILSMSSVHVYLTDPFCLSWSFMESLSTSAIIVSSDNEPVNHVLKDKYNGLLIKSNNHNELGNKVNNVLENPEKYEYIRDNARKTIIDNYDLYNVCIPKYVKLIEKLLS